MNFYAEQKIRELEQRRQRAQAEHPRLERTPNKPAFAPLAAALGGKLRRAGENLERWANPATSRQNRRRRFDSS